VGTHTRSGDASTRIHSPFPRKAEGCVLLRPLTAHKPAQLLREEETREGSWGKREMVVYVSDIRVVLARLGAEHRHSRGKERIL
jgi:hypothetical protein